MEKCTLCYFSVPIGTFDSTDPGSEPYFVQKWYSQQVESTKTRSNLPETKMELLSSRNRWRVSRMHPRGIDFRVDRLIKQIDTRPWLPRQLAPQKTHHCKNWLEIYFCFPLNINYCAFCTLCILWFYFVFFFAGFIQFVQLSRSNTVKLDYVNDCSGKKTSLSVWANHFFLKNSWLFPENCWSFPEKSLIFSWKIFDRFLKIVDRFLKNRWFFSEKFSIFSWKLLIFFWQIVDFFGKRRWPAIVIISPWTGFRWKSRLSCTSWTWWSNSWRTSLSRTRAATFVSIFMGTPR